MKKYGAVVVFKAGLTKAQIATALAKLADVVDEDYYVAKRPTAHEFDDEFGGPVWYIP